MNEHLTDGSPLTHPLADEHPLADDHIDGQTLDEAPRPPIPDPTHDTEDTTMFALNHDQTARQDWWDDAACRVGGATLVDVFFSDDLQDIARAKGICAECPALVPCLEGAIDRREPWGVWGGQLFRHGRILTTKRRRGRPSKTPRPEDQLPLIPIPVHLRDRAEVVPAA
jgi:WhiB family transcriptional regulator, redox-sensing transcriptional regulator